MSNSTRLRWILSVAILAGCRNGANKDGPAPTKVAREIPQAKGAGNATPQTQPIQEPSTAPQKGPVMTTGEFIGDPKDWQRNWTISNYNIGPQHDPLPMDDVSYVESDRGQPAMIGCADGQREGFADLKQFPDVAGCVGDWGMAALDAEKVGPPCGDDIGTKCNRAADVCAKGWHVCGTTDQNLLELTERLTPDECDAAGPGRFNAGLSHAVDMSIEPCAPLDELGLPCTRWGRGSEPVCCGSHCEFGICKDGVWSGRTRISRGLSEGCASLSTRSPGVMCCADVR